MKDIGRLQERIENIEYYTALSLLEKDTASFEVRNNQTGFNRFKSGFVVDNFSGHRVGDALNKDYKPLWHSKFQYIICYFNEKLILCSSLGTK